MRSLSLALLAVTFIACGSVASDPPPGDDDVDAGVPTMDFAIAVDTARVSVREGDGVDIGVTITRNDFTGPITVTVGGLPAGVTADPLTITGNTGTLRLDAAAGATQGDAALTVTGAADALTHDAALSILMMGPPGTLDLSFGEAGTLMIPPVGRGADVVVQPDGKIVVVGTVNRLTRDIFLARFLPDGTADPSFSGGIIAIDPTTSNEFMNSIALQSDGKIVVAGVLTAGGQDGHGLVLRFNSDGSLDTGFGTDGRIRLDLNGPGANQFTEVFALAIQADGAIVVAGRTEVGVASTNLDAVVARLTPAGALDSTFGTGGRTTIPLGIVGDRFLGVAIQADGKIVAAGAAGVGNGNVAGFARLKTDGTLDTSFSGDGRLTLDVGDVVANGNDFVFGTTLTIQADGKILAAGGASAAGGSDACFVRLNPADGSGDATFGTNGVKTQSLGSGNVDFVTGLAIQPDGKLVIGGGTLDGGASSVSTFLARFDGTNGQLDSTFGGGFVVKILGEGGNTPDQHEAIQLDADGRIIAIGFFFPVAGGERVSLARFWP